MAAVRIEEGTNLLCVIYNYSETRLALYLLENNSTSHGWRYDVDSDTFIDDVVYQDGITQRLITALGMSGVIASAPHVQAVINRSEITGKIVPTT